MLNLNSRFQKALPGFLDLAPGITEIIAIKEIAIAIQRFQRVKQIITQVYNGDPLHKIAGDYLGSKVINTTVKNKIRSSILQCYPILPNKVTNRSHLKNDRSFLKGNGRQQVLIVFHDADKAGPHLDIHFNSGFSLIRRVKPHIYKKLTFNRSNELTEASKQLLLDFLEEEIYNSSRIPQNLDHTWDEAHYTWKTRNSSLIKDGDYGAGNTRQIVLSTEAEIIKTNNKSTVLYIPAITGNDLSYIHQLYPGTKKKAPIDIWGITYKKAPVLQDKLHLKFIHDWNKFKERIGNDGYVTIKYDGASTIICTDPDGSVLYSPRISKRTGERINYLGKVPEIGDIRTRKNWIVRGELMFLRNGEYLKSNEIAGILNGHSLRPLDVTPEIRIYRVEKAQSKRLNGIPYEKNLQLLEQFHKLNPDLFKLPEIVDPQNFKKHKRLEGFVGVPKKGLIEEGYKFKFNGDEFDWKITSVELKNGPTGRTAGVVWFKSLESGKEFKLGPGQLGTEDFVCDILKHPNQYIGKVYKVVSKVGHEGRSAKLVMEHLDKGIGE